jgi:cyanophycinase
VKYFYITTSIILIVLAACSTKEEPVNEPQKPAYITPTRLTGDSTDVTTVTSSGICLMGGSTDVDAAFQWMIQKSGGGDFVVIRADVSYGYNPYIRKLGTVNSVETIVIAKDSDALNLLVAKKIRGAEALFIAGGDQADYVRIWKDSPVEDAINYLINIKKVPVGGTSAGCAILGGSYFSALKGSVTSATALNNPFSSYITLGHNDFLDIPILQNTITDQHFSQRGREGRLLAFMARMKTDLGIDPRAIAVDEETAVCIDENGQATVLGKNNAYFMQSLTSPEICTNGSPLTWNQSGKAVSVYKITGSNSGNGSVNLNNLTNISGGSWFWYYADKGVLTMKAY